MSLVKEALRRLSNSGVQKEVNKQQATELKREPLLGGVREIDWTSKDQERMKEGKLPRGVPEHPNV